VDRQLVPGHGIYLPLIGQYLYTRVYLPTSHWSAPDLQGIKLPGHNNIDSSTRSTNTVNSWKILTKSRGLWFAKQNQQLPISTTTELPDSRLHKPGSTQEVLPAYQPQLWLV